MVTEAAGPAPIRVATVEELLAGATDHAPMKPGDSLSGARFERVRIGGEPHIVKHLCVDDDWLMRATGDLTCVQRLFWTSPYVSRIPTCIDHTLAGIAEERLPGGRVRVVLLMRDVSPWLVPEGSEPLDDEQHLRFLDHMAQLHAAFWGWRDDLGLARFSVAYTIFNGEMPALEAARGGTDPVPRMVPQGWAQLESAAPRAASLVRRLHADPDPLILGLAETPQTLIQGDWKLGNMGSHPDGRTILFDWDRVAEGPAAFEIAWYCAVNCDRMRLSKEDAIAAYRAALERHGVSTEGWWDRQLSLALLGALCELGWAKTGGDRAEIGWWEDRALEAERYLP